MAHSDDHKKYVTIDNVRVSYKPKDDTIHLTSTDPDVQAGGFHLSLSKGTQTETTLRDLLVEHEVIKTILPKTILNEQTPRLNLNKKGAVLTVTSIKGGTGKTTLSLLLASILNDNLQNSKSNLISKENLRVCVVDVNLEEGTIGYILEQTTPTALNLFLAKEKTVETIKSNLIYDKKLGIHALLAPKRTQTVEILNSEFYHDTIKQLREMFDVVIIDMNPTVNASLLKVVEDESDVILNVVAGTYVSAYGMVRWVDEVKSEKPAVFNKTVNVINNATDKFALEKLSKILPDLHFAGIVPQNLSVNNAYNDNSLQSLLEKPTQFSKSLKEIIKNVTSL